MVTTELNLYIIELSDFYMKVVENNAFEVDKSNANYGLKVIKILKKVIEKYEKKQSNSDLKQMYSCLLSLSKGVEYFEGFETEMQHRKLGNKNYEIQVQLLNHIKK